jgi:hypothetical protein
MNREKNIANKIEPFRLQLDHPVSIGSAKEANWEAEDVYLSNICIAAHLVPTSKQASLMKKVSENNKIKAVEEIRKELYDLLASIKQLTLEHNVLRPVAGVISESDMTQTGHASVDVQRWVGDQDWHRGAFILYVEKDVSIRLDDLLNQNIQELADEEIEPRDTKKMWSELKNRYESQFPHEKGLTDGCSKELFDQLKIVFSLNEESLQNEAFLNKWIKKIKSRADEISAGKE